MPGVFHDSKLWAFKYQDGVTQFTDAMGYVCFKPATEIAHNVRVYIQSETECWIYSDVEITGLTLLATNVRYGD